MSIQNEIEKMVQDKFQGYTPAQLKEAGGVLGVTFGPNTSPETMRNKLLEKVTGLPAEGVAVFTEKPKANTAAPKGRVASPFDPKPGLSPVDKEWGGRKHMAIVSRSHESYDTPKSHLSIKWDGVERWWAYNKPIILPEPYYNILRDAVQTNVKLIPTYEAGIQTGQTMFEEKNNRYNIQYQGIMPGTEDLPVSLADYWHRQCIKTDGFSESEGVTRQHLMQIRSELYGPAEGGARAFYKDLTNEDIRTDIYEFLNYDEYEAAA